METSSISHQFTDDIINRLPEIEQEIRKRKDLLLANAVMIGEIPSPTFRENLRNEFLKNRFIEAGLQNISVCEAGNVVGILPGSENARNILLLAHTDTIFPESIDHTMSVGTEKISGPGIADNSLGLAVVATLPDILERLNIQLKSNLILMGAARSLGRGNLEGIRFFLSNRALPISDAICVEGAQLGRLSYSSLGMLRGEITCKVPEQFDWTRMTFTNAIITLNEVINKIVDIPVPTRPMTSIVMGSVEGGMSYNTIATAAVLRFEVKSESEEVVTNIRNRFQEIVAEISTKSGMKVEMDLFASRKPSGISFSHPLSRVSREIIEALGLEPTFTPSISELNILIGHNIPAVTVGITHAEHLHELNESIDIDPIFKGLAQLIGILIAIDKGHCDEN